MAAEGVGVPPCPAGLPFTGIAYSKNGAFGIHTNKSCDHTAREPEQMFEVPGSRLKELTGEIAWLKQRNSDLTRELIAEREKARAALAAEADEIREHLVEGGHQAAGSDVPEMPIITNLADPGRPDFGTELILIFRTPEYLEHFDHWLKVGGGWEAFTGWRASQR
jgi:hypothetical protein